MSDETTDKSQWEARNFYSAGRPTAMGSQPNTTNDYNYTVLTDGYGNYMRVYLDNRNQTYELFKQQQPNHLVQNNFMSSGHNNFQGNPAPTQPANYDRVFWENQAPQQVEEHLYNPPHPSDQMDSSEYNNPILNRLVGDWTPGTSIYGDCFNNTGTMDNNVSGQVFQNQQMSNANSTKWITDHNDKPGGIPPNYLKKPRIVAEVKPMTHRLSYSDVLSKNVPINNQGPSYSSLNNYNNLVNQQQYPVTNNNNSKKQQAKASSNLGAADKKTEESGKFRKSTGSSAASAGKSGNNKATNEINVSGGVKESKETKDSNQVTNNETKIKKKIKAAKAKVKGTQATTKPIGTFGKFKQANDFESFEDSEDVTNESNGENIQYENVYNVRKSDNYEKVQSKTYSQSTNKKVKPSNSMSSSRLNNKQDKSYSKRNQKVRKSQRYQIVEKLCLMWLEYITKLILWLWSLVSDVVYLSVGIVSDKILIGYQFIKYICASVRAEIGSNTNRPSVWIKNLWNKFDSCFSKHSKLAIWRKNILRKPAEPVKDNYKEGKLPTTADEAMLLLLNCKGKDAYSLLGVSPDCPQDQIRKHFHKIALLVHPDKNKQVGSEEAFKVLHRSFELIGEPESRQQYDQCLAEALNKEKVFSELNELLKQLHIKISEAANTIRCSSCNSRHPRKPTGRPHYAARECNSCRIRHSAREGDIWAETTLFGLRWKYLALMEGNVYDITEWANCQKGALSHLQPNSHIIQYRIVLGQNNQQQPEKEKFSKREPSASDSTFDDILSNIYSGQNQQPQSNSSYRRRHKKN